MVNDINKRWTEADVQLAIYNYRCSIQVFPLLFPNVYIHNWESDVVYLSTSYYAQEYEIKLTHQDFLADKKKFDKHLRLQNHNTQFKHFWYVCPPNTIEVSELPEYAGLLHVFWSPYWSGWTLEQIRRAPIIGKEPLAEKIVMGLLKKGLSRYWHLRKRTGAAIHE